MACSARKASSATRLPPFMSDDARAVGPIAVAPERLTLQDRVEMADQQQTWATTLAAVGRDQVPRTLHLRGHVDPACFEAERAKFARVDLTHRAHAGEVLGGARHVHRLGQQLERGVGAPIDGGCDPLFRGGRSRVGGAGRRAVPVRNSDRRTRVAW